jgi:hypothetical protein
MGRDVIVNYEMKKKQFSLLRVKATWLRFAQIGRTSGTFLRSNCASNLNGSLSVSQKHLKFRSRLHFAPSFFDGHCTQTKRATVKVGISLNSAQPRDNGNAIAGSECL